MRVLEQIYSLRWHEAVVARLPTEKEGETCTSPSIPARRELTYLSLHDIKCFTHMYGCWIRTETLKYSNRCTTVHKNQTLNRAVCPKRLHTQAHIDPLSSLPPRYTQRFFPAVAGRILSSSPSVSPLSLRTRDRFVPFSLSGQAFSSHLGSPWDKQTSLSSNR